MEETFIISVVIPSYNQAEFIQNTLDSVLKQKGEFYVDLIVEDGGSTDTTKSILDEYHANIQKKSYFEMQGLTFYKSSYNYGVSFRYTSEKDKGQYNAINKGLKKATGDVCTYINSDDFFAEYAFAVVLDNFQANSNLQLLVGQGILTFADGTPYKLYPTYFHKAYSLVENCYYSQPSVFMGKDVFEKAGFFNENIKNSGDYEYWLRLESLGIQPQIVKQVLSYTRLHEATKTQKAEKEIVTESLALSMHYSGVPSSSAKARTVEVSWFGKLLSKLIDLLYKLKEYMFKYLGKVFWLVYKSESIKEKKQIFPSPKKR